MKLINILLLPLGLFFVFSLSAENSNVYSPISPSRDKLKIIFQNEKQMDTYLLSNKTAEAYFMASEYLFLNVVDEINDLSKKQGNKKQYMEKALSLMEKAVSLDTSNAVYQAQQGALYGYMVTFTGFPAFLKWTKKCEIQLNRAVARAPQNPEIRLIRFRSLCHFPYRYYSYILDILNEDYGIVNNWIGAVTEQAKTDNHFKLLYESQLWEAANTINYWMGYYFVKEVGQKDKGIPYLKKVDSHSSLYKNAIDLIGK